jgi:hypothetical protein
MRVNAKVRPVVCAVAVLLGTAAHAQTSGESCAPGISFWKLMNSIGIDYKEGTLRIGQLYALCLPEPVTKSDSFYAYDPEGGGRLTTLVKKADGTVLNTFVWQARNAVGLWEMTRYKVVGGPEAVKPLTPGQYIIEFAVEDKPICRFPFSVVQIQNQDPYEMPGTRYVIEGAWNDYGNLFCQRNDPRSSLQFTVWLQDKTGRGGKRATPYDIRLVRQDDGETLAEDSGTIRLETHWVEGRFLLTPAGGPKGTYFHAAGVLDRDGEYLIRLMLEGEIYGEYPFEVRNHRIQFQGRQIRDRTDPLLYIVDYLYGGSVTSWWIERKGTGR